MTGRAKVNTYEATGGITTAKFAAHNLSLLKPIAPGAVVHDNAAGAGTVSRLILSKHQPDVTIHATDIDQPFLDVLADDAAANSWPISVSNQRSEATSFPDAFFDLHVANIGVIFWSGGGVDGVKEAYRTLKPGGTAVINCWAEITWLVPILMTHRKFRGDAAFKAPPINWEDGSQLRRVVLEAGFTEEKMRVERQDVEATVKEEEFSMWCERTWAFLGGIGGWQEEDGVRWREEVKFLEERVREAQGTSVVGGEVRMQAGQWVVIVEK
ncbi:S-adenosyl-L-methionine-dependent methyltransferase [Bimuria novae-zelandiae CBS 107.79]|uniref:S-adenosyl-L-methionine-dependent methyltransferase n=1 Tax=Bimuria novae-zelandiae CBS 107.79 TaxID=1447943 RepID=A0A6A5V1E9_9PLEO|nr:S-adenosyl-L-methionine-dependent methyltransferase [Bimuria novae-zelandiae CBS 107.79]